MKSLLARAVLATAVLAGGPALADPWTAVDATDTFMVFVDRDIKGVRIREARTLYVVKGRSPVIVRLEAYCDNGAMLTLEQSSVGRDLTLGPPRPEMGGGLVYPTRESVGGSVVANICTGAVKNSTAGWTRTTIREAIDAAAQLGYTPVWK